MGSRVEIPAYADMWMRGARFGRIKRVTRSAMDGTVMIAHVQLEHPQARKKLYRYPLEDCKIVEEY